MLWCAQSLPAKHMNVQSKRCQCFLTLQLGDLTWTLTASLRSMTLRGLEGGRPSPWLEWSCEEGHWKKMLLHGTCLLLLLAMLWREVSGKPRVQLEIKGEKGYRESNTVEKTKAFSAAQARSFKFRGSGFSSCSGPASHPPFPTVQADDWQNSPVF